MTSQQLTKLCLRLFIASIAIAAVMGIIAIGVPSKNWEFEIKIFLTTAIIAGASVCGLACGGCLTRGHRILPTAGLVLTVVSACLLLIGMWVEVNSEAYWKTDGVGVVLCRGVCSSCRCCSWPIWRAATAGRTWWRIS